MSIIKLMLSKVISEKRELKTIIIWLNHENGSNKQTNNAQLPIGSFLFSVMCWLFQDWYFFVPVFHGAS